MVSPVALGVFVGLLAGKVIGVVGMVVLFCKLKWAQLLLGFNYRDVLGVGFLAAIGFTMSLFLAELAFENLEYVQQAKLGILAAPVLASIVGFLLINRKRRVAHYISDV